MPFRRIFSFMVFVLLSSVWGAISLHAQPRLDAVKFSKIDEYVEAQLSEANIPGAAIAIVQNGQIVYAKGYGVAGPDGRPVTPQTPFVLASVSKPFTALAIMKLAEAEKVSLDEPVQHYLPYFRVADAQQAGKITLRHLISHTSGLSTYSGRTFFGWTDKSKTSIEDGVRSLSDVSLISAPGESFHYSNSNYMILGAIVEEVTGGTFEDFIDNEIFSPLGMKHSFASLEQARQNDLATGYQYWFGRPFAAKNVPYNRALLPAAYLTASAEDMGYFLLALLSVGDKGGSTILSADGGKELFRAQAQAAHGYPGEYAMGWFLWDLNGVPSVVHPGNVESFCSIAAMVPSEDWGFVVLVNAESYVGGPMPRTLESGIRSLLFDREPHPVVQVNTPLPLVLLGLLGLLQLVAAGRTLLLIRKWNRRPQLRPKDRWLSRTWHLLIPLLAAIILAVGLLVVLPTRFEMDFAGLVQYAPDAGQLVLANVGFAIIWGLFRMVAVWRCLRYPSE